MRAPPLQEDEPQMSQTPASGSDAIRAGAWSATDVLIRQAMQFAITITLARLLSPEDFGTIALLAVFTTLATTILEGGPTTALIRTRSSTLAQESTVFWFNIMLGCAFALLLVCLAPLIADFYDLPILFPLVAVAAAQVVVMAIGSIQTAMLSRALNFRNLLFVGLASTLVSGTVAITLALWGYGPWALSLQMFSAAAVTTAALWYWGGWRPMLVFRVSETRPMFRFGAHVIGSGLLDVLANQSFVLVLGKMHGVRELGFFNRASTAHALPLNILSSIIGRITLPLLATRSADPDSLRSAVRRVVRVAMVINVPMLVGLSVLADLAIVLLFGDEWLPAAPVLRILALTGAAYPVAMVLMQAILAQDRSRAYFRLAVVKQSFTAAAAVTGSFFGILGLSYALLVVAVGSFLLNAYAAKRLFGYGPVAQIRDIAGILAASASMAAFLLGLRTLLDVSPVAEAGMLVLAGGSFYLTFCVIFRITALTEALPLLQGLAAPLLRRIARRPG
jgi:O-antigen/teichoic acid export membrane protein